MTAVRRDRPFSSAISRAMPRTQSTCGSPPAVPAEPISAGIFALLLATRTRARSRLTASRGNAAVPEPSAKGPASVVPASDAMKGGRKSSDWLSASASTPTPKAPVAATYRISFKKILLRFHADVILRPACVTRIVHRAGGSKRSSKFSRQTDPHRSWIVPIVDRDIASLVVLPDSVEEVGEVGVVDDRPLVREVFRPNGHFGAIVAGRPRRVHVQHAVIRTLGDDELRRTIGVIELNRTSIGDVRADANLAGAARSAEMCFGAKVGRIARRERNAVAGVVGRRNGRSVRNQVAAVFRVGVGVRKSESQPLDRQHLDLELAASHPGFRGISSDYIAGNRIEVARLQVLVFRVVDGQVDLEALVEKRRLQSAFIAPHVFRVIRRGEL